MTREVQPPKKFAFSGTVTESDCHSLPARSFEIRPAGPRWKTADRLLIECIPDRTKSGSFTLTLTFTITDPPPPPPDYGNREYDFRSGAAIVPRNPSRLRGEFTDDFERCTRFATLFKEKVSQDVVSTSEHLRSSPHWSAEWAGEDQWGVAMELTLSGKFPESL